MTRAHYLLADAFPPPSGPYGIGKRLLAPSAPLDSSIPQIHIFYPTAPGDVSSRRRSRHPDIAVADAPQAAGPFPMVMYFSGWPGNAIDNYSLICELVSHGMTIATMIYPAAAGDMDYSSEAAYLNTAREANARVRLRAGHASALLDRLAPSRAALLGFSFGGAVAAEAAVLDRRFCAAVNIDGRPWGRALHEGVACPYLFLGGDRPMPSAADLISRNADRRYNALLDSADIEESSRNLRRHGGIHVTVSQAEHLDFIDGALRWSRRRWLRLKPVDPRGILDVCKLHIGAFLRHAFGMQSSALPPAVADGMPGVRVDVYPRPDERSTGSKSSHEAAREIRQQ